MKTHSIGAVSRLGKENRRNRDSKKAQVLRNSPARQTIKRDPGTRGKAVVREDTPGPHVPCVVSRKITFVGLLRDGGRAAGLQAAVLRPQGRIEGYARRVVAMGETQGGTDSTPFPALQIPRMWDGEYWPG